MNFPSRRGTTRLLAGAVIVLGLAAGGCTDGWLHVEGGPSGDDSDSTFDRTSDTGFAGREGPDTGGHASTSSSDGGTPPPSDAPRTPMLRLSSREYKNAVRDLLPVETLPEMQLPSDSETGTIVANTNMKLQKKQARYYFAAAKKIAGRAVEDFGALTGCGSSPSSTCIESFIERFGRSAFRRPLSEEKQSRFEQFYREQAKRRDPKAAVELLVQALLQSPQFLYRSAYVGADTESGEVVKLTDFEIAERLSFLIWNSTPNTELLDAAAAGELSTPDQIAAQARRMLNKPRAREATVRFVIDWLDLEKVAGLSNEKYSDEMKSAMRRQLRAYIEEVLWENSGDLEDLFTANFVFVDQTLASLYKDLEVDKGGFHRRSLEGDTERKGILTQPGFLAVHSKATPSVYLGEFIQRKLLCTPIGAPPDNFRDPPTFEPGDSARSRARARMTHDQCGSCHKLMEGSGLTFSRFDGFGRLRRKDQHGNKLRNQGKLRFGLGGDPTEVSGPPQLAETLVDSEEFQRCTAETLYSAIEGTQPSGTEVRSVDEIYKILTTVDGGFKEQIVALVRTEAFRTAVR